MEQSLLVCLLAILVGFAILIWSAERLVAGASNTALNLGVAPLVIGITVVGMGTSAPEIVVSIISSLEQQPGLAIGNAIGSNIANIALILALTALILPITVKPGIASRELPILLIVTLASALLLWDGVLGRIDGVLLLLSLTGLMLWIIHDAKTHPAQALQELDLELTSGMSTPRALLWVLVGGILLVASSRILVWGAVGVAQYFGISDLIIGLTVVAIGTSLPELAAAIAAAIKRHHELVLGNIIGSNLFNLLAVLAMPALLAPAPVDAAVMTRDVPVMIVLTLAMFAAAYRFKGQPGRINRIEGGLMLAIFISYMSYLSISTVHQLA